MWQVLHSVERPMVVLNQIQKTQFQNQGYLLLENAIPEIKLDLLNKEFDRWVEESREQQSNYGETLDGLSLIHI